MGNSATKLYPCFSDSSCAAALSPRHDLAAAIFSTTDNNIGHSYCYIRPALDVSSDQPVGPGPGPLYRTISGASVSANASTPPSTTPFLDASAYLSFDLQAASFESSPSFVSVALQPVPRDLISSGPLPAGSGGSILGSGRIERGFLSGPIERGFMSDPMDRPGSGPIGLGLGPLGKGRRSGEGGGRVSVRAKGRFRKWVSMRAVREAILSAISGIGSRVREFEGSYGKNSPSSGEMSSREDDGGGGSGCGCYDSRDQLEGRCQVDNVQWAQGKAGEDRVHVVVSEEHGWVYVGIYDGFNGPDAPDFLMSNLYTAVHKELLGLMGIDSVDNDNMLNDRINSSFCSSTRCDSEMDCDGRAEWNGHGSKKWKCGWDSQCFEHDMHQGGLNGVKHKDVLRALSDALRKTEQAYFKMAEKMVLENPELFMMGSCVLVMLMIGEDVYVMNVGDSRAVIGHKAEPDNKDIRTSDDDSFDDWLNVAPLQLTVDHNTYVKEEVRRIKNEHLDDPTAVVNNCVKGSLKVTRAFGAGFLKQPKWNEGLLEMFRIDYVGNSPYITSTPSLRHHRLGPRDKFIILSSDGLYQYFTNEEAVKEVETFITMTSEGDPAQHLIEEVLFRAAKKAGIDFHELLDIPQGERRRYHDDVSVIVISFEGRIWRSSM
ncbi:hypothetical protein Drorol1_Dr00026077 [Drosera rotundifolia]